MADSKINHKKKLIAKRPHNSAKYKFESSQTLIPDENETQTTRCVDITKSKAAHHPKKDWLNPMSAVLLS